MKAKEILTEFSIRAWQFLRLSRIALQIIYFEFNERNCMFRAAALSYSTLLSLVPLMAVSFAILAYFPIFKSFDIKIQQFIFTHFVATSGQIIQAYLQKVLEQTAKLSIISFIFFMVTAVLLVFNMERAFNDIWHVKETRQGMIAFFLYLGILIVAPILLGIIFIVSNYLLAIKIVVTIANQLGLTNAVLLVFPFILTTITFSIFYLGIPNCKVPFRHAFVSAVIAAILFETAKYFFNVYVLFFSQYYVIYGALASLPLFLAWLYVSWVIILVGVIINKVITKNYSTWW